jgi:hypothetical protein
MPRPRMAGIEDIFLVLLGIALLIAPCGLHWPDLDEDLSFRRLLEGDHGQ